MKVLLLGDVHSNWVALSAIREPFDACLVVGDLVDYGCDPIPVIDWTQRHATAAIRGNHDHAVAQRVQPRPGGGFRKLAGATRPLHWDWLDPFRMKFLARLPLTQRLTLDGKSYFLVHGTPRDPLDEYLTADPEQWKLRIQGIEADFICVGHTHVPMSLDLDGQLILNPGSVGQPRDGDARASYVMIENGRVSFRRAEFDIDAAVRQMREAGLPDWAVELNEAVLRSGGRITRDEMDRIAGEATPA